MTDTAVSQTKTTELIDTYFAMWREPDAAARTHLVAEVFTAEGRHVDPNADARGHGELNEMVGGIHAHYPGFTIERTSGIDQHGDQLRFAWHMASADNSVVLDGVDVCELSADGRLSRVAGFWGDLPAA